MEKYLFAAYIFLLGLLLVLVFLRGLKKQSKVREEVEAEEHRLLELQMDLQDAMAAMENKIEESLKEIAAHRRSIEELAQRIERKATAREELQRYRAAPLAQAQPTSVQPPETDPEQPEAGQNRVSESAPTQPQTGEMPAPKALLRLKPSARLGGQGSQPKL